MFNIFNILSVADKELVHSSIIKLLLENSLINDFFPKLENTFGEIEVEISNKVDRKLLRLDILGYSKDDPKKIEFIIENKFKATPTIEQLKLYDEFLSKRDASRSALKYLLVFCKTQVPSDVKKYCELNKWILISYFTFEDDDKNSLLSFLEKMPKLDDDKKQFLITEYRDYLLSIKEDLSFLFKDDKMYNSRKLEQCSTNLKKLRDLKFRYLLHIQSLLSNNIIKLSDWEVTTSNDGGSRPVPSVPFWKGNFMFTIDGDSLKIGFSYSHTNAETAEQLKNILTFVIKNDPELLSKYKGKFINTSIKSDKISSVISLVSYDVKNWDSKSIFIEDATSIFNKYYDIYHNQEELIKQL